MRVSKGKYKMIGNTQPLVTIGIPTYNRADGYLRQTLKSARNQTYPNIEIVVSDNCSTDNTDEYVTGLGDPRIRYFKQSENIGANNNFNFCLEQARGDYFLLLHDDDFIDDDFVETCMKAASYDPGIGIIRTGTRLIDGEGKVVRVAPNRVVGFSTEDFFLGWFTAKTVFYLCSSLFNTKRLKEIDGFHSKTNLLQDVVAEVQLAARFGRVDVQDVKASFRRHPDESTFAVKVSDWVEDSFYLLDLMGNLASEKKAEIRREGMRFFAGLNYNWARSIKSPVERYSTYWMIFRRFNYQYSPLKYFIDRNHQWRRVKHFHGKMRQKLATGA
jgi:glycosyltransferase involved in cell wall biosynthesis